MAGIDDTSIKIRINIIDSLTRDQHASREYFEAASLAQSVVHDTLGGNHPIMAELESALKTAHPGRALAASKTVITLYNNGALRSPRLAIAGEIDGDILNLAQAQAEAAEKVTDTSQKQTHLGISAFLAGASIEDALRRLCDAGGITYDTHHSSISKLQAALYQPAKKVEVISSSENKHLTAWGGQPE